MDDSYENGQEISTNDGILLKKGPAVNLNEMLTGTTGTLSLVHYINNVLCIEWKPNDFLIADADTQESDDWSFVDTIVKRNRTASESLAFSTSPTPPVNQTDGGNSGTINHNRNRVVRARIADLKHIEVMKNGHIIRLVNKSDGRVHSEYFFQHGNADGFVRTLQTTHCLQRSRHNKNLFEIDDDIQYDREKLQKTFAELKIEDIKGNSGWISNMVKNPFCHTMDFFSKMSDAYSVIQHVGQLSDLSPKKEEPRITSLAIDYSDMFGMMNSFLLDRKMPGINIKCLAQLGQGTSSNDEYELLSTSPRQEFDGQSTDNQINKIESKLPARTKVTRGSPLSVKQWNEFISEDGRISDVERVKEVIFRGGVSGSLRREVWKFLLGYLNWNDTVEQRDEHQRRKTQEYFKMKLQWLSMSATQEQNFSDFRDRKCQVEKDVKRTDRTIEFFAGDDNPNLSLLQDILMTYIMYNFDLGYVQGMSDLLAPILCIMCNEADAFWCFVGFMDMVYANFDMDQAGMKRQLKDLNQLIALANPTLYNYFKAHDSENMYFCFRWLLVWFKREFSHYDIMELWEVLWTGLPAVNFHLFISVAILDDQMNIFIDNHYEFNEILKHVNELSLKIDLQGVLRTAEAIYLQFKTSSAALTDEVRAIIGEEPLAVTEEKSDDEYDDNFDDIQVDRSPKQNENLQKKLDEACERSMYNSFF